MGSLFVALAASAVVAFGTSSAFADVHNIPEQCQSGIGATGFRTGQKAERDIVMHLWERVFGADFNRASQFISNVTKTVISAKPPVTVVDDPFRGCRFVGLVDGATEAITQIARDQPIQCANRGVDIGGDLAKLNCALADVAQKQAAAGQAKCYVTIDIECAVNVDLGCRTGFDRYVSDNSFTCVRLSSDPPLASEVKERGCNISREATP